MQKNEIDGVDRATKATTYRSGVGATGSSVFKVNPAKTKGEKLPASKGKCTLPIDSSARELFCVSALITSRTYSCNQ